MFLKGTTIVFLQLMFLSATMLSITVYKNAQFDPIEKYNMINVLSSIGSANACLCECFNNAICFTVNYYGVNQTCLLYSAELNQGQLSAVPTIMNAIVYDFKNRSFPTEKYFKRTNETIYPIWNTTAGGNSIPAIAGYYTGQYWLYLPPEDAFDGNFTTYYCSYGSGNYSYDSITSGVNTGLYLTPNRGSFTTLVAFYFVTNPTSPLRDPLTITIEGSNQNHSALTLGSSWMLIYNGSTGLTIDPGRMIMGTIQTLPNSPMPFTSYRLLVTSKRGSATCASYAEFVMIGD